MNNRTKLNSFNQHENKFLKQLLYWTNLGNYGLEKNDRIWIYNTLTQWAEQLKCSKSTVQRTIRSLKKRGLIDSAYLSCSKRNRTLFYAINYDKLQSLNHSHDESKKLCKINESDHMIDHMYYKDNNNKINKSYKSPDNFSKKNQKTIILNSQKPKNTTVQNMLRVFNEEFSDSKIRLDKNLARNLVAAFKLKFENSLEKWRSFLKLIKTSAYLMSERFKLTLQWILKFSTIDRLKLGELGVKVKEFVMTVSDDEWQSRMEKQISETDEPEEIKNIRRKIAKKITPSKYMTWFKNIKFLSKNGILELIYPSKFIEDTIKIKFNEVFNYVGLSL